SAPSPLATCTAPTTPPWASTRSRSCTSTASPSRSRKKGSRPSRNCWPKETLMAPPIKPARLIKSYAMPVDAAGFSGIPSVTALKPLRSADVLLAAAMDRRVVCCDLKADGPQRIPARHMAWSHDNWVHDLDVHPDGERVATGGADRCIKLWKWGQEKALAEFPAHDDWVRAVAFSPDGKLLASAGDDGLVKLWDVETASLVTTLDPRGSF